jgi:predicted amidohydrolase YtcJ
VIAAACLTACASAPGVAPADRVFTGGAVYTVDPERSWASAVAIRDGRIVYVGDDGRAQAWIGPETEVTQLRGRMLLPGFHDSHMHPMAAGTRFARCQLRGLEWPAAVLAELERCAGALAPGDWLRGVDLSSEAFAGDGPDISQLDRLTGDHPALIQSRAGNRFWANSLVLRMAGIGAATPEPPYGRIGRAPGRQEPNGILEGSAAGDVYGLLPRYSTETLVGGLAYASALAHQFGITSSNEASTQPEQVAAYVDAGQSGALDLRVQASLSWNPERGLEQIADLERLRGQAGGERFSARSIKFFLDGEGSHRSAALLEPYAGRPDERGALQFSDRELETYVTALDTAGFDLHFHAWGDAAVRQALDALEHAIWANPAWDRRHQIAHLALVHPDDLARFAALGVVADVQPLWAHLDGERELEIRALGSERGGRLSPVRSLIDAGARVVAGSDWISESMNPLVAIQYALTRRSLDRPGPAWIPEERASLEQMIEAYTINGAWLARQEGETGSIEVGKAADLVVLDRNLFEIDPMEIARARVLLTLLEGKEVHRDPGFR